MLIKEILLQDNQKTSEKKINITEVKREKIVFPTPGIEPGPRR